MNIHFDLLNIWTPESFVAAVLRDEEDDEEDEDVKDDDEDDDDEEENEEEVDEEKDNAEDGDVRNKDDILHHVDK